jgi:hypothetical protein
MIRIVREGQEQNFGEALCFHARGTRLGATTTADTAWAIGTREQRALYGRCKESIRKHWPPARHPSGARCIHPNDDTRGMPCCVTSTLSWLRKRKKAVRLAKAGMTAFVTVHLATRSCLGEVLFSSPKLEVTATPHQPHGVILKITPHCPYHRCRRPLGEPPPLAEP